MNLQDFLAHLSGQPGWSDAGQVTPRTRACSGDTPLHAAIWAGDDEAARQLIEAGAALDDLRLCEAETVALAALAVLASSAAEFAALKGLALESLASPAECPLCQTGVALENMPAGKP